MSSTLYRTGNITVGLTTVSRPPIMALEGKRMKKSRGRVPIQATVAVWKCPRCGQIMPLTDLSKPPKRCSNRATCGVMFSERKDPS